MRPRDLPDTAPALFDAIPLPGFPIAQKTPPFVVAIEGPNGAGKSTLCAALAAALDAPNCLGTDPAWMSEPFKVRMIRDADWLASALFFISGCLEQMRVLNQTAKAAGTRLIIMDRSLWSTLAVHAAHSTERLARLTAMLTPVVPDIRIPDLTLVLQASFETCQERIAKKSGVARALDQLTATAEFHLREQEFYRWLARQNPAVEFITAESRTPHEVAVVALARIRQLC